MTSEAIKQDGRDAYFDGQNYDANPYNTYSQQPFWSLWCDGWLEAYTEGGSEC